MAEQDDGCTPRVNLETMANFVGRRVLLACHLEAVQQDHVTVKTSDGGSVTVRTTSGKPISSSFVEVVGRVENSQTITEESHTNLGDNYDLALYNEVVKLSHGRFADIFMPTS